MLRVQRHRRTQMTLVSRLPEIARNLKPAAERKLDVAVGFVVWEQKAACPVQTGRLRASIHAEHDDDQMMDWTRVWIVADARSDEGVPYANIVEFGTMHRERHPAHPFFVRPFEANRGLIYAAMAEGLRTAAL